MSSSGNSTRSREKLLLMDHIYSLFPVSSKMSSFSAVRSIKTMPFHKFSQNLGLLFGEVLLSKNMEPEFEHGTQKIISFSIWVFSGEPGAVQNFGTRFGPFGRTTRRHRGRDLGRRKEDVDRRRSFRDSKTAVPKTAGNETAPRRM